VVEGTWPARTFESHDRDRARPSISRSVSPYIGILMSRPVPGQVGSVQVTSDRLGDDELTPSRVTIDGELDGLQRGGHLLPLVDRHRSGQTGEDRAGRGRKGCCDGRVAEPHDRPTQPLTRRGLACRARADDHDDSVVRDHLGKHAISGSLQVDGLHDTRLVVTTSPD
jgi:hypothetical protein